MNSIAMDYASQALYLVLVISLPPIVIASVIGIVLSLVQAVTQLQEQTLTFGVKLIAVVLSLFLLGGWMSGEILRYADEMLNVYVVLCLMLLLVFNLITWIAHHKNLVRLMAGEEHHTSVKKMLRKKKAKKQAQA